MTIQGTLPDKWSVAPLRDLLVFVIGGDWGQPPDCPDPNYVEVLCIRASEVRDWATNKGATAALRRVKSSSLLSRRLQKGDIVIEISGGGPEQPVGRTLLIDDNCLANKVGTPKICTNFFRLMRPSAHLHASYLELFLQHFYCSKDMTPYQGGSNNLRNLKFDKYLTIDIPLPPFREQGRIVAKIDKLFSELDKGVESLIRAREQLRVYRQAALKHAFEGKLTAEWRANNSDKLTSSAELRAKISRELDGLYADVEAKWRSSVVRWESSGRSAKRPVKPRRHAGSPPLTEAERRNLPHLPESWQWVRLGEIIWSVKDGPHYSPAYSDTGIPFITGGHVRPEGVDFSSAKYISPETNAELSQRCKPEKGDVLYTKGGTTGIARVNTYDHEFNVWVHVAVLKLAKSVRPFYLQHALNSPFCYAQSQTFTHGVGNQDLGLTRMVNIVVPLCSEEEQQHIEEMVAAVMSRLDDIENVVDHELNRVFAMRQSILKKAFSGQLVAEDPNDEPASILLERIRSEKQQCTRVPKKHVPRVTEVAV